MRQCVREMRLDPDSADGRFAAGMVHAQNGRPQRAVECFSEAIRLNPLDGEAYQQRAAMYRAVGPRRGSLGRQRPGDRIDLGDVEAYRIRGGNLRGPGRTTPGRSRISARSCNGPRRTPTPITAAAWPGPPCNSMPQPWPIMARPSAMRQAVPEYRRRAIASDGAGKGSWQSAVGGRQWEKTPERTKGKRHATAGPDSYCLLPTADCRLVIFSVETLLPARRSITRMR